MSKVLATQNRKIKPNGKKGVEIRLASGRKDINEMIILGRLAHEESLYADLPYDENKLTLLGERAQERPDNHGLIMAELQGKLIGFLVCIADEHFFSKAQAATCLVVFVKPQHRGSSAAIKLLHAFRKWAAARKIERLHVHVTTGVNVQRTDKLLKHLGFKQSGGNYVFVP